MIEPLKVIERYSDRIPVPVFQIIKDIGLELRFEILDDEISGWIERKGNAYEIVINQRHPLTRRRFTAAHELGHYIYHRDLLGAGTGDTRAYRAEHSPLPNALIRPKHERQANSFAANLLMPPEAVATLKAEGVLDTDAMADRLEVSEGAMRIRLGDTD
ncbi:ImmA/IrrE family metallo-endopeptidase [Sphingomonas albertensis]|uniref:ImmA/IrrE family metallo-endopeptidase n=1 Tax=Sphingomonas albertensis TaxID=2762591 RepID=A0ABR7ANH3_9SPHN|nr:ImmA/IrrE family metallo-endopeptidase [Sphingomonas albertensis]MBC3942004.1 ImmA/IrrE family metallo-endopeptidase [Sphingomonas albertensis]